MANWAIVIGIDRNRTEWACLKGAVRDALHVREWLLDPAGACTAKAWSAETQNYQVRWERLVNMSERSSTIRAPRSSTRSSSATSAARWGRCGGRRRSDQEGS